MKKSNNIIGIVIMICILAFAGMKAFEVEFNMHNIKVMLAVVAASVVGLMLLFSLPNKTHETNYEYYERERIRQQQEQEQLAYQEQFNQNQVNQNHPTPQHEDSYQQNSQPEPDNRYNDNRYNQYQQPYNNNYQQPQPPVQQEEDNRWS